MLLEEKSALGFCLSGSLFDEVASAFRRMAPAPLSRLMPSRDSIWIAGVVTGSRAQATRRGMMRVLEIEDGSARIDVTVFDELFDSIRGSVRVDDPILVQARVDHDDFSGGLRALATEVLNLSQFRDRFAKCVFIHFELQQQADPLTLAAERMLAADLIPRLRGALNIAVSARTGQQGSGVSSRGSSNAGGLTGLPVSLAISAKSSICELGLGSQWRVPADRESLDRMGVALGPEVKVSVVY
jgi:DNA polymerase III alpha subunit